MINLVHNCQFKLGYIVAHLIPRDYFFYYTKFCYNKKKFYYYNKKEHKKKGGGSPNIYERFMVICDHLAPVAQ